MRHALQKLSQGAKRPEHEKGQRDARIFPKAEDGYKGSSFVRCHRSPGASQELPERQKTLRLSYVFALWTAKIAHCSLFYPPTKIFVGRNKKIIEFDYFLLD